MKIYKLVLNYWFKLHQSVRFLLLGGYNFVFNNSIFALLVYSEINYKISLVIAWVIGVFNNTLIFRYFLFQSKNKFLKELQKSYITYLGILALNYIFLYLAVDIYKFNTYISQIIISVVLAILTYFLFKIFTFKN